MNTQIIFLDTTTTNGRCTIKSQIELPIRWFAKNGIHRHNGQIYNNLITYHPTKKELENLQKNYQFTHTSFGGFVC